MRCFTYGSVFVLSLAAFGCTSDRIDQRAQSIINGQTCSSARYPATAGVLYWAATFQQEKLGLGCTGILIAPDVVLTAGHCTQMSQSPAFQGGQVQNEAYYVTFQADLTALVPNSSPNPGYPPPPLPKLPADTVMVKKVVTHPSFDINSMSQYSRGLGNAHDIGLLFLKRSVTGVEPAVVITKAEATQLKNKASLAIAGYGQTSPQKAMPGQKQTGKGVRTCADDSFVNELGPHEMMVGGDQQSARKCHGDSGGPSYLQISTSHQRKLRVVGITSRGYDPQVDCYMGGIDTRVDAYLDWIDSELRKACKEGIRSWCTEEGIIPPSFYDEKAPPADAGTPSDQGTPPKPTRDAGTGPAPSADLGGIPAEVVQAEAGPGDDAAPITQPNTQACNPQDCDCGCSVGMGDGSPQGTLAFCWVFLGLFLLARRRR